MIRKITTIIFFIFLWVSFVAALQQEKPKVDYRSDLTKIIDKGATIQLIGNVAFHHNGAVITCDTAYRYKDKRFEGIGNVIINSDSTFIYGDRFTYDEKINIARVYAPIIKTVDKDAILYTRNMEFNTLENKGSYYGGGTVTQTDNLMESERGDYFTKTRDLLLGGSVEMHNDDYLIKSEKVGFNLDTEFVTFLAATNIWSKNGEFLRAERGSYDRAQEMYTFIDSAYIMSKDQEVWADSIQHWSSLSESELRNNVQITDTTQNVIALGDYGHYWGKAKKVVMTRLPAIVSYDRQNPNDSTFMCADTLLVLPALPPIGSVAAVDSTLATTNANSPLDSISHPMTTLAHEPFDTLSNIPERMDSLLKMPRIAEGVSQQGDATTGFRSDSTQKEVLPKKEKVKKEKKIKKEKKPKKERKGLFHKWMTVPDSVLKDTLSRDTLVDTIYEVVDTVVQRETRREADSSDYIIRGFRNVKIFKKDLQAVCDTIVSISQDSTLHLIDSTVIWNEGNQITAALVILYSKNGVLDRSELFDYPIMSQQVDTSRFNQIRGKEMEVFFKNNELDIAYVDGNAQTVFYQKEEEVPVGVFTATSGSMAILFDSSQMNRIKWYNNITTQSTPLEKITSDQKLVLDGFAWHEDIRPKSQYEITDRKLHHSQRKEAEAIEKPLFGITEAIEKEKKTLSESGVWRDRSEPLPITREEIIFKE